MSEQLVKTLNQPVYAAKGWIKLIAVLSIIYGGLTALSIIGIIIAWLPIWMGVVLFQAASGAEEAQSTGSEDAMLRSQAKIKLYFTILGIVTLVGLILMVLAFIVGGVGLIAGLANLRQQLGQ